jgi:hypothetical protein
MSLQKHTRFQLAHRQLEAAIALYITNRDRLSTITLAGAADVILSQLVLRSGYPNFTDRLAEKEVKSEETVSPREIIGKQINDLLFINQLKHFDDDAQEIIEIDVDECALAAILKALANYVDLPEHDKNLVLAFKVWVRANLDPKKYNLECDPNWVTPSEP